MRNRTLFAYIILFMMITSGVGLDLFIVMQEAKASPSESWSNRFSHQIDYGNGTYTLTLYISPQVFWNNITNSWQELRYENHSADGYYLLQNSHVAVEIYDYYAKYFDPDYQHVCVYMEQ